MSDYLTLENDEHRAALEGNMQISHVPYEGFSKVLFSTIDSALALFLGKPAVMVELDKLDHLNGEYHVKDYVYVNGLYCVTLMRFFKPERMGNPYVDGSIETDDSSPE